MNNLKKKIRKDGFIVIKDFFSEEEASRYRALCDNYFNNHSSFQCDGGKVVPGWAGNTPEMEELNLLYENSKMTDIVSEILGDAYLFAEHSDLHQDKITGWHRDTYDYQRGGGVWPQWTEDFFVIKVAFLLQDHSSNDHGLWMDIYSHRSEGSHNPIYIPSGPMDLIIFDQKINHRGQSSQYLDKYGEHRYLITYGYGLDNEHTLMHNAGCKKRQDAQRLEMK
jgi:hypothetical protein